MKLQDLTEYSQKHGIAEKFWYNPRTKELFNMHEDEHGHHVNAVRDIKDKHGLPGLSDDERDLLVTLLNDPSHSIYSGKVNHLMNQNNWVRVSWLHHDTSPNVEAATPRLAARTLRMMMDKGVDIKTAMIDIRHGPRDNDTGSISLDNSEDLHKFIKHPAAFPPHTRF